MEDPKETIREKRRRARSRRTKRKEKKETHVLKEFNFEGPEPDLVKIPEYVINGNLRYVETYTNVFMGYVKRWTIGKTILQHTVDEFRAYPDGYQLASIKEGRIIVNNKIVSPDYVLIDGDHITHFAVWDETPVINQPIDILSEDDLFIVVSKPSSMPVHPCGNFKYNSLIKLLEREYAKYNLKCVHWLDW